MHRPTPVARQPLKEVLNGNNIILTNSKSQTQQQPPITVIYQSKPAIKRHSSIFSENGSHVVIATPPSKKPVPYLTPLQQFAVQQTPATYQQPLREHLNTEKKFILSHSKSQTLQQPHLITVINQKPAANAPIGPRQQLPLTEINLNSRNNIILSQKSQTLKQPHFITVINQKPAANALTGTLKQPLTEINLNSRKNIIISQTSQTLQRPNQITTINEKPAVAPSFYLNTGVANFRSPEETIRIPKPSKRDTSVLSEDGSRVVIPTPPSKRRSLQLKPSQQFTVKQAHCNHPEVNAAVSLPAQLFTPAVKTFRDESENLSELSSDLSNVISPTTTSATKNQDTIKVQRSHKEILEEMLPSNYSYKFDTLEPLMPYHKNTEYDQSELFTATLLVNLRNKEEALQWVEDFKESSLTDWRVRKCYPENTRCLIFKKGYRCTHNTQAQFRKGTRPHAKHTLCDAYLQITVHNYNMKRSTKEFLQTHPCEIILHHSHNHPIEASDVLRFRRPTPRVVDIFLEMFRKEHSPSSALSTHQYDIQVRHPTDWFEILADGAECPNLQWCYHLYRKTFSKEYGPASGEGMVVSLSAAIEKYNAELGSVCASVKKFQETDLMLVLCSPLMKRVHKLLKSSGEINFLDSGGSMDRQNSRIFTILAPSVAGALPLGMIISTSESEDVLTEGMTMLKSLMPSDAFFGRGPAKGPAVMMTDDSRSERNALQRSFPDIVLLLCFFHILQAFWTYVWDSKHKVKAEEKEEVFFLFKDWCYSKTQDEFKKGYNDLLNNPLYSKNNFLVKHVKGLFLRAPEWALCYRSELLIRGNNTNNYSEITIRQYKEQVMHRLKAYSVVQLFDFFTTRLESYFERRIAAVVNNRKENYWTSKHYINPSKLKPLQCSESSHQHMYVVKNVEKKTVYTVDMHLEICSCPVGSNGAPCKHQFAVAKKFNLSTSQFLPYEDDEAKAILHQIMTTASAKPGWYAPLKGGPATCNTAAGSCEQSQSPPVSSLEEDLCDGEDILGIEASSGTSAESAHPSADENEARLALWETINLYISNGLKERPEVFGSAVEKFASQFNKAKALSENAVLSAMHTFSVNSFGSKAVRRGRYINVNNAAKVRRKYASLAGRKCTQQGRPPKSAFTREHGYSSQRQVVPAWSKCNQRKGAVPHNLSVRIQHQASKSHSKSNSKSQRI